MAVKSFGRAYLRRTIRVNSIRKGLLGGSKFWLAVFGARFIGARIQTITKRGEMPVRYSEKLEVGQRIEISHLDPSSGGRAK